MTVSIMDTRSRAVTLCCLGWVATACLIVSSSCRSGVERSEPPTSAGLSSTRDQRHLLIVLDGLRPDYVTPEVMPNLYALGQRGVVFRNHHAVYPTVTRVNASSISTGAYPSVHGLMGNSVFFPTVDPTRFLSTSDRENLLRIEETEGELLTAPTLADALEQAGRRMLVMSSGSSGSSYLLNHTVAGGGIIHYDFALPASLGDAVARVLGDVPPAATPNLARNRFIVDAFFEVGLPQVDPSVTVMWLSDPDTTAHQHGIGDPISTAALSAVDTELARIQEGLREAGLLDEFNIWVTSDHGFSTHTGGIDIAEVLAASGADTTTSPSDAVVGAGAIYVRSEDPQAVSAIVTTLQATDGVGAIFTAAATPRAHEGWVPGTLSFETARWAHARSADILYSADWTDEQNTDGFPGTTAAGGTAGHGSSSPFDIHNILIAAGPALKVGAVNELPSGNVDFAPTFLSLLGVPVPVSMEGRVLREAMTEGPEPGTLTVERRTDTAETPDGGYKVSAVSSIVDGSVYLDYTEVVRKP